MSGALSLPQVKQLEALANSAYGELFGKVTDREGVKHRARYSLVIKCSRCGTRQSASWISDGVTLFAQHLGHTTRLGILKAKRPDTMPTRNAARIDLQKDSIYAELERGVALTPTEIAATTGLHVRTVSRRLRGMRSAGEVTDDGRGHWRTDTN